MQLHTYAALHMLHASPDIKALAHSIIFLHVLTALLLHVSLPTGCCSSQLGTDISDGEAKEAVRILDSGSTGYIQVRHGCHCMLGVAAHV
jgi:hypothetical protein